MLGIALDVTHSNSRRGGKKLLFTIDCHKLDRHAASHRNTYRGRVEVPRQIDEFETVTTRTQSKPTLTRDSSPVWENDNRTDDT